MWIPDFSGSMYVAHLRYIQSIHESAERRNPDSLVRQFIPVVERWRMARLGREELAKLRAEPFYYYLVARTKHYDQVVNDAISAGAQLILNVGCGNDTRAYRFKHLLRSKGIRFVECDQPDAIKAKRRMVKWWRRLDNVEYLPIDLNDDAWPELERLLGGRAGSKALVLMEGVSMYINDSNFGRFLRLLATRLPAGSHVAYDFKIRGVNDAFGRVGRTQTPFRLSGEDTEVVPFHEAHGLRVEQLELGSELCTRLLGEPAGSSSRFDQDCLVRLVVGSRDS